MRNIDDYFSDRKILADEYGFFVSRRQLIRKDYAFSLADAHMAKSGANLEFASHLIEIDRFHDWAVVGLYYAVYHACLALVAKNGFVSKNHTATLVFLIRHYGEISSRDLKFVEELALSKEDAEFYVEMKRMRHDASYSTGVMFDLEKILIYRRESIMFINKMKDILEEA